MGHYLDESLSRHDLIDEQVRQKEERDGHEGKVARGLAVLSFRPPHRMHLLQTRAEEGGGSHKQASLERRACDGHVISM